MATPTFLSLCKLHRKKKTINSIVIVPVDQKLPTLECLTRKAGATNKNAGETESKAFYSISRIFCLISFNYDDLLCAANGG